MVILLIFRFSSSNGKVFTIFLCNKFDSFLFTWVISLLISGRLLHFFAKFTRHFFLFHWDFQHNSQWYENFLGNSLKKSFMNNFGKFLGNLFAIFFTTFIRDFFDYSLVKFIGISRKSFSRIAIPIFNNWYWNPLNFFVKYFRFSFRNSSSIIM